jgi:hypothetical protein
MTDALARQIIEEIRLTREYFQQSETRIFLIQLAESQVDRALGQHIGFVKKRLGVIYAEAKKNGNQAVCDALDHAPISLLPEEK